MSDEEEENKERLFSTENMVMGLIFSGLAWGGVQIMNIRDAQASLVAQQYENTRVNELVYETIPKLQISMSEISANQTNLNDKIDDMRTKVNGMSDTLTKVQIVTKVE